MYIIVYLIIGVKLYNTERTSLNTSIHGKFACKVFRFSTSLFTTSHMAVSHAAMFEALASDTVDRDTGKQQAF